MNESCATNSLAYFVTHIHTYNILSRLHITMVLPQSSIYHRLASAKKVKTYGPLLIDSNARLLT